jgi:hypothetical protein
MYQYNLVVKTLAAELGNARNPSVELIILQKQATGSISVLHLPEESKEKS